ncbi:hypothetical protein GGI03_006802, partial [Coemansia sp. RSA 2337]
LAKHAAHAVFVHLHKLLEHNEHSENAELDGFAQSIHKTQAVIAFGIYSAIVVRRLWFPKKLNFMTECK